MKINQIFILALLIISCQLSNAQGTMVMAVEGNVQGKFKPESDFGSKFSDKIEVLGFVFEVSSPRDIATGMASGKRTYQPIIVWKKMGESSPQFFQALITNEPIKKITIEYHKPDPSFGGNSKVLSYTVLLENAAISSYKQVMGPLAGEKFDGTANDMIYDEIRVSFEKITVTENKGKGMATDTRSGAR